MNCRNLWLLVIVVAMAAVAPRVRGADSVLITEFVAVNETGFKDDTGEFSDWIEIYNRGTNAVNLSGYYLTDEAANLTQWRFPATNLLAGRHLLVFASGLDRVIPGKALHTNFKLDAAGEYLALVHPDGVTVVSDFGPAFPPQQRDRAFGVAVEDVNAKRLVAPGEPAKLWIPTANPATNWNQVRFDDSNWLPVTTAIKYDRSVGPLSYDNVSGTDIETQIYGLNSSVFIRVPFAGIDAAAVTDFQLLMRYDDGFVAYLNGQEIARRLSPALPQWNATATVSRSNDLALVSESINLIDRLSLLQSGTNVLAIQALNRTIADADFLMSPELLARGVNVLTNVYRFFATPTPGAANISGLPGTAGHVEIAPPATTFVNPLTVTMETDDGAAGAVIRYTLDRTVPTEGSPAYTGPIRLTNSTLIRARVFAPGLFAGSVRTEGYVALSNNVVNVSSDLPILVIHSFGGGRVNGTAYNGAFLMIHEPVRGRSYLTNSPHLATRAAFKDRGSSTAGQAKANYAVELWDEADQANNLPILGLPAESDWVFHAPFSFDPALIRNPLAYEMGHQLGRYASRYRFAEVYINGATTSGPLAAANYAGVYNILEKVKIGKDRVDIDPLRPGDVQQPEVTGGYIMKIDRLDPGDGGVSAGGRSVAYVEPKEPEIELPERDPQEKYIASYLNQFNAALISASFTNATRGYAPFIDSDAWIDHNIVDALTFNVDALVLSSYFHKVRNGPLVYGPLWDFDRALGSTDGRDTNPRVWGANFFTAGWWNRLFRDPDFWQKWIDRWQNLRQAQFSNPSIMGIIDSLAAQVAESAPRDLAKWRQTKRGGSQAGEITHTKNWLANRLNFFDTNLLSKPVFSHGGGQLHAGFALTMTGPLGATIHYTVDGTDPRLPGGQISPAALVYSGPVGLASATIITARSRNPSHRNLTGGDNPPITSPWSGVTRARFTRYPMAGRGPLVVSEILFDPSAPSVAESQAHPEWTGDDFEFVELKNSSSEALDLAGARFVSGIDFSFGGAGLETLGPGQLLVLAKNPTAFAIRYGARTNLAGPFGGVLDNNGEKLEAVNAAGDVILDVEYRPGWSPLARGQGYSLVRARAANDPAAIGLQTDWSPSATAGGSPGADDPTPMDLPAVVINEVLANTDRKDAIELMNSTTAPANVGGWFLTDDRRAPKKFRIPDGTIIPAGGFRVFDEDDFNSGKGNDGRFSFSRLGEEVFLFSADRSGNLLWYTHGFEFGASDDGVTFGRYVDSTGTEQFIAQAGASLGVANAGPKTGPIVISEIMYHPPDVFLNNASWDNDEDEYIELQNLSDQAVPLFDPANPTNTWRLRSVVDFNFPTNMTVPTQGFLLIVGFNPAANPTQLSAFRSRYGLPANTAILGPFRGKLGNSSGDVRLARPGEPDFSSGTPGGEAPNVAADIVEYRDRAPWPEGADGIGHSLQRVNGTAYGNDPANWSASAPTPGAANRRGAAPTFTRQPEIQSAVTGASVTFVSQAAGSGPVRYQWRFEGANLIGATNSALTLSGLRISDAGQYSVVAANAEGSVASRSASLQVLRGPVITVQPQGRDVNPGTNAVLSVTATGTGPLGFRWLQNGTNIFGATGPALVLTNLQLAGNGAYTVVVTDSVGSSVSDPAVINVLYRPAIVTQPESQLALEGDRVVLSVAVTGTPPLVYRWRKDGIFIAGATNPVLTLPRVQLSDTASYSVIITNLPSVRSPVVSEDASLVVWADLDNDRLADLWETAFGLSSTNASDARLDLDGDGLTNLQEFVADTDPRDPRSYLKFDSIRSDWLATTLEFSARSNRNYTVQFKPSVNAASWMALTNIPGRITNRVATITDSAPGRSNRFYRLVTPVAP